MNVKSSPVRTQRRERWKRKGFAAVLAAACMTGTLAFAAFTIDVGYIGLTKSQLQAAADAAALGGGLELLDGMGPIPQKTPAQVQAAAYDAVVQMAAAHFAGGEPSVLARPERDVRMGRLHWDPVAGSWEKTWNATPYNMVEVTLRRDAMALEGLEVDPPDGPLPLFFAPVIGHSHASLSITATAALIAGTGFRLDENSTQRIDILPIALDQPTWESLCAGIGKDNYCYNPDTGKVTPGSDGVLEVNLYPEGNATLPPGNRGTVDIGSPNNSTADLSRQILYGVNAQDLSYFGGTLRWDQGPLILNGDTGLSAGIKDELLAIKGQVRAIPIFTHVSGPGNNAMYTIVKFVGVRIMSVKLTGRPSQKHVTIQPAPFISSAVIRTTGPDNGATVFSPLTLIR